MFLNRPNLVLIFLLIISIFSCRGERKVYKEDQWSKEHSVDFNQEVNEREQLQINLFLAHHYYLNMNETYSGLRYMIFQKSKDNELAKEGQMATIRVRVELLDGRICDETPIGKTEMMVIGKSNKESGIHEALKLMRKGERAKLILPSYLGHGLLGDRTKIPPQSVLYIDLELIDLK
jgi:FKBP-type peptidyl-prolyl cis-trans isomerase FkpA